MHTPEILQASPPAVDGSNAPIEVVWTRFDDAYSARKIETTQSWASLIETIKLAGPFRRKADCPWVKLARFGDKRTSKGALRNDANVRAVTGIEVDYDGEVVQPEEALAVSERAGIRACIYTSPSSTADKPRWRLLAPTSRPLPPELRARMVSRINGVLGGILAGESWTLSQSYFYGRVGDDYRVLATFDDPNEGSFIDELDELDEIAIGPRTWGSKAAAGGATGAEPALPVLHVSDDQIADLRSALAVMPADDRTLWIRMGHALKAIGEPGRALWLEWSRKSPEHDPQADPDLWDGFRPSKIDYRAVFTEAQGFGWTNPAKGIVPKLGNRTSEDGEGDDGADADAEASGAVITEDLLAQQLVDSFVAELAWTPGMDWMRLGPTHWARDDCKFRFTASRNLCRKTAKDLKANDAKRIGSAKTVAAVVQLAQADQRIIVPADAWDQDLFALNTPDGIVDLRTMQIRARTGADRVTQCAKVSPDFRMPAPNFLRFLTEVFDGDEEMVTFVQRVLGYCCTGDRREQKIFFCHGVGSNGKSTLLDLILWILAGYALKLPATALMSSKTERHPTERAMLRGRRLAVSSELEDTQHWAEPLLKELSGDETLSARFMRNDWFEFRQTQKHLIAGNSKPRLHGGDAAMARRMVLIPFDRTFEGKHRDDQLPMKLRAEAPAVLAWLIKGAHAWHEGGLRIPASVTAASTEYMAEHDDLALWLGDCCVRSADSEEPAGLLFASFRQWKESRGEHPPSMVVWAGRMSRVDRIVKERRGGTVRYTGVRLQPHARNLIGGHQ